MPDHIFDISYDPTPNLAAVKAAHIDTVIGYVSSISPQNRKCWTTTRMQAMARAEMFAGVVHEGYGGTQGKGISRDDGLRDGPFSRDSLPRLGAPRGAACYFACDVEYDDSEINSLVLPYFEAIATAFNGSGFRVGVYGEGDVCQAVMDRKLASLSWLTNARGWPGYAAFLPRADIVQHLPSHLAGLEIDSDSAKPGADIGTFIPWSGRTSAPIIVTADTPGVMAGVRSLISHWA
jgi:hypothetical protein